MNDAHVDIVIPAYGREVMLAEAIRSVLAQTHAHFRLVIVDDASPQPVRQSIPISDARIEWLTLEKNLGPGAARNWGVAHGTSPYVSFLDSDDLWHPQKLSKQLQYLKDYPGTRWVHADEEWLRHDFPVTQRSEYRKQGGRFLERAFERCLISPSSVLIARDFFESAGGFGEKFRIAEDFELWLRLLHRAPIGYLAEALTTKRAGAWDQLSSTSEIDRQRVLALHRFWRQIRSAKQSDEFKETLCASAIKKCQILLKGAKKYLRTDRARQYQAWLILFETLRTRAMRASS